MVYNGVGRCYIKAMRLSGKEEVLNGHKAEAPTDIYLKFT